MSDAALLYQKTRGVAWLTLNRPKAMNSLNWEMVRLFERYLDDLEADTEVRVVVLTGKGPAFCAGADLKEALENQKNTEPGAPEFIDFLNQNVLSRIRDLSKPVIAAINGITLAGGLETALTADIIIASDQAKIGDGHATFGVYPGAGGAALLPRVLPLNVAKYLLFTGEPLSAQKMKDYGLVNKVVAHDQLLDDVQALSEKIASHSPIAIARMKTVANKAMDGSRDHALLHEQVEFRRHQRSADIQEGLAAFMEKRKPKFIGR